MDKYGADGMRFGLMLQTTGSQDIRFAEEKLISSRNFANKIWNASRFVLMNVDDGYEPGPPEPATVADAWILSRLADLTAVVDEGLDAYEFGDVARALYEFFWNEFCDWYIELSKPRLLDGAADDATDEQRAARLTTQRNLVFVLDRALRLLHPMMPFVTEEIWRNLPLAQEDSADSLMIAAWPTPSDLAGFVDEGAERSVGRLIELVVGIRAVRARYQLSPKQAVTVVFKTGGDADNQWIQREFAMMHRLAGVEEFSAGVDATKPDHAATIAAGGMEVYVELEGLVDFDAEKARVEKQIGQLRADLEKLQKKLGNEQFLAKAAPEIIEKDRANAAELEEKVSALESQLAELG
jgi:valyl-tRNA synthetase